MLPVISCHGKPTKWWGFCQSLRIFFTDFWYRSNAPWMFLWAYGTNFPLILIFKDMAPSHYEINSNLIRQHSFVLWRGQWSYLKRDPTWLAMWVSREPISTAFTQLSPYFMTRIWTRGVATDVMFNAITGVYFKLVIGLALLGSLYKFIWACPKVMCNV